jgi:hypothetical protein
MTEDGELRSGGDTATWVPTAMPSREDNDWTQLGRLIEELRKKGVECERLYDQLADHLERVKRVYGATVDVDLPKHVLVAMATHRQEQERLAVEAERAAGTDRD